MFTLNNLIFNFYPGLCTHQPVGLQALLDLKNRIKFDPGEKQLFETTNRQNSPERSARNVSKTNKTGVFMKFRNFVSINIAVIGTGKVTKILSRRLIMAGHKVFIGLQENEFGADLSWVEDYNDVYLGSIEDAGSWADVIIIATEAAQVRAVSYFLEDVRTKIIIDCSSVIAAPEYEKVIHTASVIRLITGCAHVVKCFNYSGYEKLLHACFNLGQNAMAVAGGSMRARQIAALLASDLGMVNCHDLGDDDIVHLLEDMAVYWVKLAMKEDAPNKKEELVKIPR